MAWIRTLSPEQVGQRGGSGGRLRKLYDDAVRRAGKVFNILRIQSLRPDVLQASTQLYMAVMHSPRSGLSRAQREMIATAVSRHNDCHY